MSAIRYWHFRLSDGNGGMTARGGVTIAVTLLSDGREALGIAICSLRDTFAKARGRTIASGRALSAQTRDDAKWAAVIGGEFLSPVNLAVHAAEAIYRKRFSCFYHPKAVMPQVVNMEERQ